MPMHNISSDDSASKTEECITNGAMRPATSPLAVEPTNACMDEAMGQIGVDDGVRAHLREVLFGVADWMRNRPE